MKKLIVVILALVFAISLVACGSNDVIGEYKAHVFSSYEEFDTVVPDMQIIENLANMDGVNVYIEGAFVDMSIEDSTKIEDFAWFDIQAKRGDEFVATIQLKLNDKNSAAVYVKNHSLVHETTIDGVQVFYAYNADMEYWDSVLEFEGNYYNIHSYSADEQSFIEFLTMIYSQTSTPVSHDSQNNSQTGTTQNDDSTTIAWTINKVENQVSAAMRNFSTDKYYSEKKTLADITAYFGRDLSKLETVMPQGFEFLGRHETDFFYELDGDVAYDSCVFGYKKDEQKITIRVSKIGVPYDCVYILNNPTVSNLNGIEVTVGGIYKTDNSGEFKLVFADFSHGGLQYRVTIENVPSDDHMCLISIVNELSVPLYPEC